MQHSCGNEMLEMGHWPSFDRTRVVNRFHCKACNEYIIIDVPEFKLVPQEDGWFKEVPI